MDYESQANLNFEQKLADLDLEHRTLIFQEFNSNIALEIGLILVNQARAEQKSITVDITMGSHQLFHCALEGTTDENDQWVIRKNRVAIKFQKSSYYISMLLKFQNKTIEEAYDLSSVEYAPFGGAYPIITVNNGFIGTITVSGLPDYEDHEMVVNAVKWYLNNSK
jgi:uncharacterized protein (UPF0303 family)